MSGPQPISHGTRSGYDHYKCRCEACVEAARVYRGAYREGSGGDRERKRQRERYAQRNLEAEKLRKRELRLRKRCGERPVEPMPFYRFLAEMGESF